MGLVASAIAVQDDEIDDFYNHINQQLRAVSKADPQLAHQALFLSQAAHELERVGDRATNICEWVLYAVTGELLETNLKTLERTY